MSKTGLVLEGGGVRGIYTAGVLDVFMAHGLQFDGLIGVSAGAIHGCSYLSGQQGRSIRYYRKYVGDPRFMSLRSWIRTGDLVGVDFCYHELPDRLDVYDHEAFLRNPTPFYAVCTNVETGQAEYLRITDMRGQIDVLRASASLPYCSRIVEIGGCKYLDGDTPAQQRVQMTEQFNGGQGSTVLISLKAGGTGLNLTGADMVIHYDPWWNPAAEDQATDRAYRIGQTRKVEVIRLVTHGSIEEQVVALGQRKKALFDQLIKPGESQVAGLSPQEIMSLFR